MALNVGLQPPRFTPTGYEPIGDNATTEEAFQPSYSPEDLRKLIKLYKRNPTLVTPEKVDTMQKHAVYYNVPFYRGDFSIVDAMKEFGKGFLSGFTTLHIGEPPDNEYEAIANSLGHLIGFAPGMAAAPLKAVGASANLVKASAALGQYSVPMFGANLLQKKVKSIVKPALATAAKGKGDAVSTAAKFLTKGRTTDMMQGAFHLGAASAISNWQQGIDGIIDAGLGGAMAGGVFKGIGNLVATGSKAADTTVKTLAGSLYMGLPATMRGATTPEQVYEYLLGAYFGGKEGPWYKTKARKKLIDLEKESKENNELLLTKDPRLMKNFEKFEPEVQQELIKLADKTYGNTDIRKAFGNLLLKGNKNLIDETGQITPEGFTELSKVVKSDELVRLSSPNQKLHHGVSGGAEVSDSIFAEIGAEYDVPFVHYSFKGHQTRAKGWHQKLRKADLDEAVPKVRKANETLERGDYDTYRSNVKKLIQRNWFQVKNAKALYAIGNLEKANSQVRGGTGWAVQMAVDAGMKDIYVFNLNNKKWHKYNVSSKQFEMLNKTPKLKRRFAGIGTSLRGMQNVNARKKTEGEIRTAIEDLYQVTFGKKKAKKTKDAKAKDEKDIPVFTPESQKEIIKLQTEQKEYEEAIYQFNKELKDPNITKTEKGVIKQSLRTATKELNELNQKLDSIKTNDKNMVKEEPDVTDGSSDGTDIGMRGNLSSGDLAKRAVNITDRYFKDLWNQEGLNRGQKTVLKARVAKILQDSINKYAKTEEAVNEVDALLDFEKQINKSLPEGGIGIKYTIPSNKEIEAPLRQWLTIKQFGKPVRYVQFTPGMKNPIKISDLANQGKFATLAGKKVFVVEPTKEIEKAFSDIGGKINEKEPVYVVWDTITELSKDGFYKDYDLSEYRSSMRGKNAQNEYDNKFKTVSFHMRKKGYYPFGGKGDADSVIFVKYHPFVEKGVKLSDKIYTEDYRNFKQAIEPYLKGDLNIKNFAEKFGLKGDSKAEYLKQLHSNVLYDIHMNGWRPQSKAEYDVYLKRLLTDPKKEKRYIPNATALNKRQQIWFTPGWNASSESIESYLPERLPVNKDNKLSLNYIIAPDISKKAKGNAATEQHLDGQITVRDDVIKALARDFGLEEVSKQGNIKSFIVSPDSEKGALLGKYMMHSAGPEATKDMKAKDIHMIMQESAVKQRGEREIKDFEVSDKGMTLESGTEIYKLPIEHMKYSYSVKNDRHMLSPRQIPKQLLTAMTYSSSVPFTRETIEQFTTETVYRKFTGEEAWNQKVADYLKNPNSKDLQKLVKNIDRIGIEQLLRAVKEGNSEFADVAYLEMMKFNRQIIKDLIAEGEITEIEAKQQEADLQEFNTFSDKMINLTAEWAKKEKAQGRDASITPILLHKEIAPFRTQVIRNYIMHNISRPKMGNSTVARMRGYDKWMQRKFPELNKNEEIFYLDDYYKDLTIKTHIKGIENTKLGDLWKLYTEKTKGGKDWVHKADVEEIFRALTVRVPMDSVSGAQVLQFGGFTGRKGHGVLLHGKKMEREGGADLDGDETFIFFGGKQGEKGDGFRKKWKDEFYANKDEFDLEKEPHKNDAARKLLTTQDSRTTTGIDPKVRDSAIWKYNPGWRVTISERARDGRNLLGPASNIVQLMRNFHSHLLGKQGKKDSFVETFYFGKKKKGEDYIITVEPRKDTNKGRKLSASMVAFSADPLDEAGLKGYQTWFKLLHNAYFKTTVKNAKTGKVMGDQWQAKNQNNIIRALHGGLYKDLREMNKAMFSKNYANKTNYNSNAGTTYSMEQIREMTKSTRDISKYGSDDISNTILPKLGSLAHTIEFKDSAYSRVHKESVADMYKEYAKIISKFNKAGLKALNRNTIAVKYNPYVKNVVEQRLWDSVKFEEAVANNDKFKQALKGTSYLERTGGEGFPQSRTLTKTQAELKRRSVLKEFLAESEKYLINDITDMVSGNLVMKYIKKLKPSEVKEAHRMVEKLKNESYLMAKQLNTLIKRADEHGITMSPTFFKIMEDLYKVKGKDEFNKQFPWAKSWGEKEMGLAGEEASILKNQVEIDAEIASHKKGKSKEYKNFFDVLMLGSLRRGDLSRVEKLESKYSKELLQEPALRHLIKNLKFMDAKTTTSRLGFSSDAISNKISTEFLGEFSKIMKKSWKVPKEAVENTDKEILKKEEKTIAEEYIDPAIEGTEMGEIYKGFEKFDGADLDVLTREHRQLATEINSHLEHFGNVTARKLNEIIRGIIKKDIGAMNMQDWGDLNNVFKEYRKGTIWQRLFNEKTPDMRRRYWWQFPETVGRELMKYDIMFLKKKGMFLTTDGVMGEGSIRKPTSYIAETQKIIGRMNEVSDGISDSLVGDLRLDLTFIDTFKEGEKLREFAVAEYEMPEIQRIQKNVNMSLSEKRMAINNYQENYNRTKKEADFDAVESKKFRITNRDGEIENITGREIVDRVKNVYQKHMDKAYEIIEGTKEHRKLFKDKFVVGYFDKKTKLEPIIDFNKFIRYIDNKFQKGESIDIGWGLTNLRHVARNMQIDLIKRNPNLKPSEKVKKIAEYRAKELTPVGKILKGYWPHIIQNRKKALTILKDAVRKIYETPETEFIDGAEGKVREIKKLLSKTKTITGEWVKGTENWEEFDNVTYRTAIEEIGQQQKDRAKYPKWSEREVITGNMLGRNLHLPGHSLEATAAEKYLKNQVGAYFRQFSTIMSRDLLSKFHKAARVKGWDKLRNPGENLTYLEKWDRFLRLYIQDSMGNPSIVPQEYINDPGMKLSGTPYAWWADNKVKEKVNKIAKKIGIGKNDMKIVRDNLERFDENDLRRWSQLEAKFELMSLLAHPKSMVQNIFGGSLHTIQSAGLEYIRKARDISYIQKIFPNYKSMEDVNNFVIKHGVLPEFIINELGLTREAQKSNVKSFISDLSKKITKQGTADKATLNELQKKYRVGERVLNFAARFMSEPEKMLRRDAFMAHYIKAWERFGGAIKNPDHPFLIEQAKKAVKATQFLYSAPYRPAFARTALGKVMTRFQLWAWNSAKFRNDVYRQAKIYGFRRGTEEFDKFRRTMQVDLMVIALANVFAYSIFEQSLPAPFNWLQDTSEWIFGDENERNRAFFGNWPTAVAPLQMITPPIARLPVAGLRAYLDNDYSKLSDYYIYTMFPFGRIARDVLPFAKGNLVENPTRLVEKMTGFPLNNLARFKNDIQDEKLYFPRKFGD